MGEDEAEKMAKELHGMPKVITEGHVWSGDGRLYRGFAYVSGRVKLASGHVLPAVLNISVRDQGEHWGTFVLLSGRLFDLHKNPTVEYLEDRGAEVFPYDYNYDPVIEGDIHIKHRSEIKELSGGKKEELQKAIDDFEMTSKIHEFKG